MYGSEMISNSLGIAGLLTGCMCLCVCENITRDGSFQLNISYLFVCIAVTLQYIYKIILVLVTSNDIKYVNRFILTIMYTILYP